MKMLDLDVSNMQGIEEIDEKEALEFLKIGKIIVCQVNPEEFIEFRTESDFHQCKFLKEKQIYDSFKLFLEN